MKINYTKILIIGCVIGIGISIFVFCHFQKIYTNIDFNIKTYLSSVDKDNDGVDDQTDILNSVKKYIETRPKYKSVYYSNGYPDDEHGVCTDVVAQGLLHSGYDLQILVDNDIEAFSDLYTGVKKKDDNIDFRRVVNLDVYFKNNHIILTNDIYDIEKWQGGDIVVFKGHIGIVSDRRNKEGIPFIYHHANPFQLHYEEDILKRYKDNIIGHYRVS